MIIGQDTPMTYTGDGTVISNYLGATQMREIKFRAWDKITNKMADVEAVIYETRQVKIAFPQSIEGIEVHPLTYYRNFDDVDLLQYTGVCHRNREAYDAGIFDKDGNEMPGIPVCEGDIVVFVVNPSFYIDAKIGDKYVVEYYGAGFYMKPISFGVKKMDAANYAGILSPYQTSNMSNHYKVIGNIYENPELMEEQP